MGMDGRTITRYVRTVILGKMSEFKRLANYQNLSIQLNRPIDFFRLSEQAG